MRRMQLSVVLAASLFGLAACSGPKDTGGQAVPLPGATVSSTPATPTPTLTPSVTPSPAPTVKPTPTSSPTVAACAKVPWNTNPQTPKVGKQVPNPILTSDVTWENCFDRFTVVLKGSGLSPYYRAEYVRSISMDGSGDPVPLKGKAFFQLIVRAPVVDRVIIEHDTGKMIQQARSAGSFEGQTTYGIGLDTKRPFAVRVLPGPSGTTRVMVSFAR